MSWDGPDGVMIPVIRYRSDRRDGAARLLIAFFLSLLRIAAFRNRRWQMMPALWLTTALLLVPVFSGSAPLVPTKDLPTWV